MKGSAIGDGAENPRENKQKVGSRKQGIRDAS